MAQGLYSTALTPPVIQSSLSTAETMLILPAAIYKRITFLDSLLCDSQGSKVILLHILLLTLIMSYPQAYEVVKLFFLLSRWRPWDAHCILIDQD